MILNTSNVNGITGSVSLTAGTPKWYQFGNVLSGSPAPVSSEDYTVSLMVTERTVLKNLCARLDQVPGAAKAVTFTIYVNGVASALTLIIGAAATQGVDTTDSVVLNPGDFYSMYISETSGGAATKAVFGVTQSV